MGLTANMKLTDIKVDHVFIGSCTNGRIEDLRAAAAIARGKKVAAGVNAIVVPGSGLVKEQAEEEGLDKVFVEAGFEWRDPGCSMCLAMNADRLQPGERCASTSNRNFEGRQGRGGRTHLVSPAMAAGGGGYGPSDGRADALGGASLFRSGFVARAHVLCARSARRSCSGHKIPRALVIFIFGYSNRRNRRCAMARIPIDDFKVDRRPRAGVRHKLPALNLPIIADWNDDGLDQSQARLFSEKCLALYDGRLPPSRFYGKDRRALNGMQRA